MDLVRLGPSAAAACADIEAELFAGDDPWSQGAFVAELSAPNNFYVGVVKREGELCGYGGITKLGSAGAAEYEIHTIGVASKWQGRGLGAQLMDALMAAAGEDPGPVFLEVRTDNAPAIALYEKYGFERMGLRKNYYPASGADAYTMCRPASACNDSA
ncbi:ribosomal protein S18-alanine N-acetyltransferase [Corynebacterium lactis]|uniref:Alanine acetyltransferase n=1 Tax=Corynebacterium lactis RW2-5 TaxID=1408189 RepID=A0A0K2GY94_9CORY|nr:ribosomal protein S18-alanine N-acetyltransferase [Corynebacterium lactis]ALA66750.1 alanine acetyltransferase [Corynebacterium lactis RW2-5]